MKQLRDALAAVVQIDPGRVGRASLARADADSLAPTLPLVHRAPDANTMSNIFGEGHISAPPPKTQRECACGVPRAAYFFLGCAAYPIGTVVFMAKPDVLSRLPASFTPFDTGSLDAYAHPRDAADWEDPARQQFVEDHIGSGRDALAFAAEYLAAHFSDVRDYVRRPQQSEPDDAAYHGLVSTSGDRRAWTIEVQLHANLPVDSEHLQSIVLAQSDLLTDDVPDDLVETLVIAENDEIEAAVCGVILEPAQ